MFRNFKAKSEHQTAIINNLEMGEMWNTLAADLTVHKSLL